MTRMDQLTQTQRDSIWSRIRQRIPLTELRDRPAEKKPRGQKYGNRAVVTADGEKFDSQAEHKRWLYLVMLQKAGEIKGLRRQVPYELIPAQKLRRGGMERATKYIADFVYLTLAGVEIVEDVKGAVTPEFRLKRKLMLWVHGIEVQEVRS